MRATLKLARIGMTMEEATITRWHKQPGERFKAGDALYEIETEKVAQAVEATADGTLLEVFVPEGETVAVGDKVCSVDVAV